MTDAVRLLEVSRELEVLHPAVLLRAGNCYEGSPAYMDCRAGNGQGHPVTGSMVVLTIAHMDYDLAHNDGMDRGAKAEAIGQANLRALCQRCHLRHDRDQHAESARKTREAQMQADVPMLPGFGADGV